MKLSKELNQLSSIASEVADELIPLLPRREKPLTKEKREDLGRQVEEIAEALLELATALERAHL